MATGEPAPGCRSRSRAHGNRTLRHLFVVVLAAIIGLGGGAILSCQYANQPAAENQGEPERVEILVATKRIAHGEVIKQPEQSFKKQAFLPSQIPPGAVSNFEQVRGKYLSTDLRVGDFVGSEEVKEPQRIVLFPENCVCVGVFVPSKGEDVDEKLLCPRQKIKLLLRKPNDGILEPESFIMNALIVAGDRGPIQPPFGRVLVNLALSEEEAVRLADAKHQGFRVQAWTPAESQAQGK